MRLPGTLIALSRQLDAVGWGTPQEIRFDADGNVTGIVLRPPIAQATTTPKPGVHRGPRRSPSELFGSGPPVS